MDLPVKSSSILPMLHARASLRQSVIQLQSSMMHARAARKCSHTSIAPHLGLALCSLLFILERGCSNCTCSLAHGCAPRHAVYLCFAAPVEASATCALCTKHNTVKIHQACPVETHRTSLID